MSSAKTAIASLESSPRPSSTWRSEEHTSELQSQSNLVCRLLLEKKNRLRYTGRQVLVLRPAAARSPVPQHRPATGLAPRVRRRLPPRRYTRVRSRDSRAVRVLDA